MMEHWDYVVVGAGIEGSWTALQLVKLRQGRVLLLEQFSLPHTRGSSHGHTRIIRHAYEEVFHAELMPRAYQEWHQLEREVGETLFIPMPLLCVADESGHHKLEATLNSLRAALPGQEGVKFRELTSQQLSAEFPQATFSSKHRGCLETCAGILLADKCLTAVQRRFRELGGEIRDRMTVTSLTPGPRVTLHLIGHPDISAGKVAVCAGPWTSKLMDPLLPTKLPLTPVRVNVYYWRVKDGGPGAIRASYIDMGEGGEFWGIPEYEYPGLIKLCSHNPHPSDPDNRDQQRPGDEVSIGRYIDRRFPGLNGAAPSVVEYCMYTMTPDGVSIIDRLPGYGNVAFACGFSGTGFKKAPVVGTLISKLLHTDAAVPEARYFARERFVKPSSKM